jgi:hypothetical protein
MPKAAKGLKGAKDFLASLSAQPKAIKTVVEEVHLLKSGKLLD